MYLPKFTNKIIKTNKFNQKKTCKNYNLQLKTRVLTS